MEFIDTSYLNYAGCIKFTESQNLAIYTSVTQQQKVKKKSKTKILHQVVAQKIHVPTHCLLSFIIVLISDEYHMLLLVDNEPIADWCSI